MLVQPYLSFEGRCEEAIEFYKKAAGAEVNMLMRFKDAPESCPDGNAPGTANKVMHASLQFGDSTVMASDGRCTGEAKFSGISLSLTTRDDAQAEKLFSALGDGGNVALPMAKTFFSSRFGIVTDRFGVTWMIMTGR